ncbi:MAG: hypothetical protein CL840_12870 [Crocinitomicaceae bacterium]|nr:hypothetical protein [Crocinitomicaceae bacterium]|tara:strand:+ start:10038 stop:10235 length:198 start_codon:yes stop_codon:yes gene_type:complete
MDATWIVGIFLLLLPILAGGMILMFISTGKGKSSTTEEILAVRHEKMLERDELKEEDFEHEKPSK